MSTAVARIGAHSTTLPVAMTTVTTPIVSVPRLMKMDQKEMVDLVQRLQRQAVIRQTPQGPKVGIVHMLRLEFGAGGDVMELPAGKDREGNAKQGPILITAKGYYRAAAACGLQIVHPQTVLVDGEERSNPHYERNKQTGMVERAVVRVVVIGRNAAGQFIARDQTAIYSPFAYLMKELHAKQAYERDSIKVVSRPVGGVPDDGWEFFPEMEVPGTGRYVGLLVKLANPEVLKLLKLYSERITKILEFATTFASRNALKKMLEIHVPVFDNGVGYVPVVSWTDPTDEMVSQRIAAAVQGGNSDDFMRDLEREGAQIIQSAVHAEDEEEPEEPDAEDDDASPTTAIPVSRPQPASEPPPPAAAPEVKKPQQPPVDEAGQASMFGAPATQQAAPSEPAPHTTPLSAPGAAAEVKALKDELAKIVESIGRGEYELAATNRGIDPTKPAGKGTSALRALIEECRQIEKLQAQEREQK